jgi:hypothetical protein
VATPENKGQLLKVAKAGTAEHVERIVRGWRYVDRQAEAGATARLVMGHDAEGRTAEITARTRTIPPALRRALLHRDRGCRFPGCGVRIAEGHHIHHWALGGPTILSNLALLCRRHHRAVHEEGFRINERRASFGVVEPILGRQILHILGLRFERGMRRLKADREFAIRL